MATSKINGGRITQTIDASDFIDLNEGFTTSPIYIARQGRFIQGRFVLTLPNDLPANSQVNIGKLKSAYRPAVNVGLIGSGITGIIATDGTIYVRYVSAKTAGNSDTITFIYLT